MDPVVQAWILMTQAQRDAATALDNSTTGLGARQIENTLADNLGVKESLDLTTIVGMWVATARVLTDPAYVRYVPTLGSLPIRTMENTTLFNPPPPL